MRQLRWVLVLPLIAACHTLFPHAEPPAPTPDAAPSPGDARFDQAVDQVWEQPLRDSSSDRRPANDRGRDGAPVDQRPADLPIGADLDPCAPLTWNPAAKRCYRLTPSNVATEVQGVFESSSLKDLTLTPAGGPVTFNTDDGGINPNGSPPIRGPGIGVQNGIYFGEVSNGCITTKLCPSLGLFVIRGLTIKSGVQVNAIGSRPLVIYATKSSSIAGTISVSAFGGEPGPGGVKGGSAASPDGGFCEGGEGKSSVSTCPVGGAGAGFGGIGGAGGMSGGCAGGPGGQANGDPALAMLRGGCGGAMGNLGGGAGGHGGGALQISVNGTLQLLNPILLAHGAEGTPAPGAGGGGGGSGGGILLEAAAITGSGAIKALGGNGGAGECAAGGAGGGSAVNGVAGNACPSADGAGGGGGSAGRIRIHAKTQPPLNTIPLASVDTTLPVW